MHISLTPSNTHFFEALASETRLRIIQLLAGEELNIKELAARAGISSPIMLKHIKKLEEAGLVSTRIEKRDGALHKICTLLFAEYILEFPKRKRGAATIHEFNLPVGHYADAGVRPTCGLATEHGVVGDKDDPRVFFEPERVNAQLLWFSQGYVEYNLPNYLTPGQTATEIELSFEISSEAPDFEDNWPSDISISFNGVPLCVWTSPGDYGLKRGVLTPSWWEANQYGLLKMLRLTEHGVYLDDKLVSYAPLSEIAEQGGPRWTLRFEVKETARHVGGLTLFGRKFGNHEQDIRVRTFYTEST